MSHDPAPDPHETRPPHGSHGSEPHQIKERTHAHEPAHGHGSPARPPAAPKAADHPASAPKHSDRPKHQEPAKPHPAQPGRRTHGFWTFWFPIGVVLLLILVLVYVGLHRPAKKPPAPPAIPVAETTVRTGSINVILDALGIVTPVYTVTVESRVTGEITEVDYQEGQLVKKGDKLIVIDPRPYAAAVAQASGQLALGQAMLDNARIDLKRYEDAFKTHAIPQQQLATQQATVKGDEGTVVLDQANLDAAQINLDYSTIRSPIDGRIGLRDLDPGNIVTANATTALATITQLQPITVIFTVPEDSLNEIVTELKPGAPLRVDALDRAQLKTLAQGTLGTLDNQVNTATGTIRARATFANSKNELFPNEFVNAKLYVKTLTNVTLVPTEAVQHNETAAFVYVVQPDNKVKTTPVTVTVTEGETAAITGVKEGDKVVTDGFEKLQDGTLVAERQPAPKGGANPGEVPAKPAPAKPDGA